MLLWATLALGGCYQDVLEGEVIAAPETEGGSSSTSEATPTTSDAGEAGVQTATGATEETAATSLGPNEEGPPTIGKFDVKPELLSEAGKAEIDLETSQDVIKVNLWLDGIPLLMGVTPETFPRFWEALSAKDNGEMRKFSVEVEDDEGLTAMAETSLTVQLPAAGEQKCIFEDGAPEVVTSSVSALESTADAIYAVGPRDTGDGLRLTLWKLDPDDCTVVAGWPKTLGDWSEDDALGELMSIGSAIDVDEDGNVVVAGNFLMAGMVPQSYVALLTSDGARLWEQVGVLGDEVMGVAAMTGQFKDRVVVVGARRTDNKMVVTDGMVAIYQVSDGKVFVPVPMILKAPFTDLEEPDMGNVRSEWVRAVVIDPKNGEAMAVGEREIMNNKKEPSSRAFTVRLGPFGEIVGQPWSSLGPTLSVDAARSVAVCGDKFVAGGWTHGDGSKAVPLLLWIEPDGSSDKARYFPELDMVELNGVACDRELKIVSVGTHDSLESDAQIFTVQDQLDPVIWYDDGVPNPDAARAVACDPRGLCGWGGFRTIGGKARAVVRVHHP